MSFSFGFSADSDDEFTAPTTQTRPFTDPLSHINPDARPATLESFQSILHSLKDVRTTFEAYTTPKGNLVYRRELFDVKHQLMMEENDDQSSDEFKILIGDDATDLKKNVYEGGLKSWECSVDTVDKLSELSDEELLSGDVIELGCGTALPSTYLFKRALMQQKREQKLTFVLADYNSSVLRLVTLPNLIITWASLLDDEDRTSLQRSEDDTIPIVADELQFTEALLTKFFDSVKMQNINIELISGAWSRQFVTLTNQISTSFKLIITSETIYAPETLPIISELVIELIQQNKGSMALVAAKDIYFGVGGSLVEFQNYLEERQQHGVKIEFEVQKVNAGLKRSIVLIKWWFTICYS